jgi:hypothetical protein
LFFFLFYFLYFKFRKKSTVSTTTNVVNVNDNVNRITYDEFAILVRRIDRMEYSIGNIVSRVKKI